MADKFSIDDILEEYSHKTPAGKSSDTLDFDELLSESVPEIPDDTLPEPTAVQAPEPAMPEQPVQPRQPEPAMPEPKQPEQSTFAENQEPAAALIPPESTDDTLNINIVNKTRNPKESKAQTAKVEKAVQPEETLIIPEMEQQPKRRVKRTSGNTAILENIKRIKRERAAEAESPEDPEPTPVNRPKVKDIDMGLTGKILPKTEQMDVVSAPQDDALKMQMLSERRKKKVDDFVLSAQDNEEEDAENRPAQTLPIHEFTAFDQAPKIADDITRLKGNLLVRLAILLFTSVISVYLCFANDFGLPLINSVSKAVNPETYLFLSTILAIISAFVSYTVIYAGIRKLIRLRADCDSVAGLAILITIIAGIVGLFHAELLRSDTYHVYTSAAILGLLFNTLGKLMIISRTERNFTYVSGNFDKHAVVNIANEETALKFTKGSISTDPQVATIRKTEFTDDFLANSYSSDLADEYSRKFAPLLLAAGLLVGLVAGVFDKTASGAYEHIFSMLTACAGTIALGSSLALMLIVNIPLAKASKKYLRSSAVILGYSTVEDFADTNSVLVDSDQLFPNGTVDLVNLKALSSVAIEECILLAASLACQAGSILKPTFYKILRGKTEMLYPVESYIYEDGLGLSGWIENKRVLFGTREHMLNHSIEGVPSIAKEKEYAKGNIVLYLSVSGVISSLFVIRCTASMAVKAWMQELDREGLLVIVRSVDSFISLNFLTETFEVRIDSVKLLPFRYHKDYERETTYAPRIPASMMCSGHFPSLAMLITGVKKIQFLSMMGVILQMSASILGVLIALIMTVLGSFGQLSASVVLCYLLGWLVVTLLLQGLKRF